MRTRITFFVHLGLFWVIFFIIAKAIFLLFNLRHLSSASFLQVSGIFIHGLPMDLSATGYIMLPPGLLITISAMHNFKIIKPLINLYTTVLLGLLSLIIVIDAEIYKYWGFRFDISPLLYVKTPAGALASIAIGKLILLLLLAGAIFSGSALVYHSRPQSRLAFDRIHWLFSPAMLLMTASLIIPIRGGFGIAPMNIGNAYFSRNNFFNHAAINIFWNLGFSIIEADNAYKDRRYFGDDEARLLIAGHVNANLPPDSIILKTRRPNIILLILESFTSKVIGSLHGMPEITPEINRLRDEGVFFTNFYANGDRSDKGLLCILSGYPAQPNTSIIKYASKTRSLPRLSAALKDVGYFTSFYYGGDVNFANMRSYLFDSRFDVIVSIDSFPRATWNLKWGAHDHVVFQKLFSDLSKAEQPNFSVFFTLSSHEPFEVPCSLLKDGSEQSKFLNSIHYTDSCVGDFIRKCKSQSWWENTLIILVADHGHRLPGSAANHAPEKFKIPMLWLGGALSTTGAIEKFASQIDIPNTLLSQMNIASNEYYFSKNIISSQQGFAFYSFNNGFGLINEISGIVFDCGYDKVLEVSGVMDSTMLKKGKAYLQGIFTDMEKR